MRDLSRFAPLFLLSSLWTGALGADTALRLTELGAAAEDGLDGLDAAVVGGELFFVGRAGAASRALYRYDGVNPPTLVPDSAAPNPVELVAWNGKLYFQGGVSDRELWSYDPAGGAPSLALDVRAGGNGLPQRFAVLGDRLCFGAFSTANGFELFCWDGTTPVELFDLVPGTDSSFPDQLFAWGTRLVFGAQIGGEQQLWLCDGTNSPAQVVPSPGESFDWPFGFASIDGDLYFTASDEGFTSRLWRYDGVAPPSRVSPTVSPWGVPGAPRGVLFVSAEAPDAGVEEPELFRLVAGELRRASPGITVGAEMSLVDAGGAVAFIGESVPASGDLHLFRYCGRGSLAPTDAFETSGAAVASEHVVAFAGKLLLTASDAAHGEELWSVTPSFLLCDDFETGDTAGWN